MTDQGIVLRLYPLSETSLIVVWLTSGNGLRRTAAKSILKPGSPFHGHIDLFYHNELSWAPARKGDLHHLTSTSMINPHPGIRNDYDKLSLVSYFSKLIIRTVEPEHEELGFYDLFRRAVDYLDTSPANKRALTHFERELVALHGIGQQKIPAYLLLKNQFGDLPRQRDRLWERLPER